MDECGFVFFVHAFKERVWVRNLVQEKQLREHVLRIGNLVILDTVGVQRAVHLFHEARHRLHARLVARNFRELERAEFLFKLLDALHVGGILERVVVLEFHHHVKVVKASELSAEHVLEPHHEGNLFAHSFGVVHVHVDTHHSRNLQQHYRRRNHCDNNAVPAHLAPEEFKENVRLGGPCRLYLRRVGFCILAEAHENRNQDDDIQINHRDDARRNPANPADWADACEQERNQRCDRGNDGKENWPTRFFDGANYGFAAVARAPKMHAERIDVVDGIAH